MVTRAACACEPPASAGTAPGRISAEGGAPKYRLCARCVAAEPAIRELLQHQDENGLAQPVQFRVPVFQRTFEWQAEAVHRLVDDVLDRIDAGAGADLTSSARSCSSTTFLGEQVVDKPIVMLRLAKANPVGLGPPDT